MSLMSDDISQLADDMNTEMGDTFTYHRGSSSTSITLAMSSPMPYSVDNGNGQIVEVRQVDFKAKTILLPYLEPLRGDRITGGGMAYEVQPPPGGSKVFYRQSPQMTRIHTKQVN